MTFDCISTIDTTLFERETTVYFVFSCNMHEAKFALSYLKSQLFLKEKLQLIFCFMHVVKFALSYYNLLLKLNLRISIAF